MRGYGGLNHIVLTIWIGEEKERLTNEESSYYYLLSENISQVKKEPVPETEAVPWVLIIWGSRKEDLVYSDYVKFLISL